MRALIIGVIGVLGVGCVDGGASTLVRFGDEPAGDNCPGGGVVIHSGIDDDGDGVLDDGEILDSAYVCDGADGDDGMDGDDGSDGTDGTDGSDGTNGADGEDGEDGVVDVGPVISGDFTVNNSVDLALLAGVETITGRLYIQAPGLVTVTLPDLLHVGGDLTIGSSPQLTTVSMPALQDVGGDVNFASSPLLASLSFPSLTSADALYLGTLAISDLDGFGSITSVGGVGLTYLPALTDVSALVGTGLTSLALTNTGLTDLDALAGIASLDYLGIGLNSALLRIDLPTTAVDSVSIFDNPALLWLTLPGLVGNATTSFQVTGNAQLPRCHAQDILTALVSGGFSGSSSISGGLTCQTIGFCRLQFPLDLTTTAGTPVTHYGRVYVAGLTTLTTGVDTSPVVVSAVGIGADNTSPSTDASWLWAPAIANASWVGGGGEANNDEYQATRNAPAAGTYDMAYRFSGDRGRTWTYCDRDAGAGADGSQNGYQTANAGNLTVN